MISSRVIHKPTIIPQLRRPSRKEKKKERRRRRKANQSVSHESPFMLAGNANALALHFYRV
jgi:hypothetical protein